MYIYKKIDMESRWTHMKMYMNIIFYPPPPPYKKSNPHTSFLAFLGPLWISFTLWLQFFLYLMSFLLSFTCSSFPFSSVHIFSPNWHQLICNRGEVYFFLFLFIPVSPLPYSGVLVCFPIYVYRRPLSNHSQCRYFLLPFLSQDSDKKMNQMKLTSYTSYVRLLFQK
jgi:hypothetical protein